MQGFFHLCIEPPSALHRSGPLRSAVLRCAPLRSAAVRAAPAPLRSAPRHASARRAAPLRSAPLRSAPTPLRSTPLRCAPRRARSAPLRPVSVGMAMVGTHVVRRRRGCALQTFEAKVAAGQFVPNFFSFPDAPRPRKKVGTFLPVSLVTVHAARLRAFLSAAVLPSVVACLRASVLRLSCGGWRAHTCSAGVYTQGVRWCWRTCCARACALLFVRCLRHAFHNAPRHGWRKS